jgi:hypothetical protein
MRLWLVAGAALFTLSAQVIGLPAFGGTLSTAGADLGRVNAATLAKGLVVTAELGDDRPLAAHVIARFKNNEPLTLGRDGLWEPWDGDVATLPEASAVVADGKIAVRVLDSVPEQLFYPVYFTLVYRTPAGMKFGTLVLEGP